MSVHRVLEDAKEGTGTLELEVKVTVSQHGGAGNPSSEKGARALNS